MATKSRGPIPKTWYPEYWAQTWYRNTFLVRAPNQIARERRRGGDWNSIYDSGCNFTCLAIITGIDPARLASALATESYFSEDRCLRAVNLLGEPTGLVWDQNVPNEDQRSFTLRGLWHTRLARRVEVTMQYVKCLATASFAQGDAFVSRARSKGRHIVCGPDEHSHLVAGTIGGRYFVWDPDDTARTVEDNLAGRVTLDCLFDENPGSLIEFWEYALSIN